MLRQRRLAALLLLVLLAAGCGPIVLSPFPRGQFEEVDRLLEDFRERHAFPGGVLAVGHDGALVHLHPFGRLTYDEDAPAVTAATLYDLASLTKVVATTTLAMILVDEGKLDLDRRVQDFLPEFQGPGKDAVTVRHLLSHSSGLPATAPLYREARGKAEFVARIEAMDLAYPPGSKSVYSDLGIILLGEILERLVGQPLEVLARERVLEPLGMRDTLFLPPARLRPRIAPTEFDPWRGRLIQGEVHDENAYAMGGAAPHAGLFGTAGDLARLAQMLLDGGVLEGRRIVSRETVELFTRRAGIPDSDRALGWDTKSAEGSSAGTLFSPRSFGHTGFTGTSIWMDPDRRLYVILLTNRVHPTRENNLIREARPAVADAVVRASAPAARGGE
jgi:CubicO group peptidase (beta-lactamase class C family)